MTPEQFCYWLQGRAELLPDQQPTAEEWQSIRDHLATVFHKVTPPLRVAPFPSTVPTMPYPTGPYTVECTAGDPAPLRAISIC